MFAAACVYLSFNSILYILNGKVSVFCCCPPSRKKSQFKSIAGPGSVIACRCVWWRFQNKDNKNLKRQHNNNIKSSTTNQLESNHWQQRWQQNHQRISNSNHYYTGLQLTCFNTELFFTVTVTLKYESQELKNRRPSRELLQEM